VSPGSALVLGLDIGGSSSRARLSEGGRVVAEAEGMGANVATIARGLVERRLTALIRELGPAHPVACCAGAAGAEVPAARIRLEELLARSLPGCRVTVVHDARLVLAAAGLASGIALIAGTGSVAYGLDSSGRVAGGLEVRATAASLKRLADGLLGNAGSDKVAQLYPPRTILRAPVNPDQPGATRPGESQLPDRERILSLTVKGGSVSLGDTVPLGEIPPLY